jgi:hypothetical protein
MISKRFPGWQARGDAGENSCKYEFHANQFVLNFSRLQATASPSMEEKVYALQLINEGARFASDCKKSVWQFATELHELINRGISRSLIRWLVCKDLVEHRFESPVSKVANRQFFEAPDLVFDERSCFVLSAKGHDSLVQLLRNYQSMISQTENRGDLHPLNSTSNPNEKPIWCPNTRVLKVAGKIVKHFKWPAPNQEKLIAAFAELGWPNQIDDPLPQNNVCPKRRLHDTIKCLNRKQIHGLIKFRGDGTGRAARWEFRPLTDEE